MTVFDPIRVVHDCLCDAMSVLPPGKAFEAFARDAAEPRPGLRGRMETMCHQLYEVCEEKGEGPAMRQARAQAPYYMKGPRGAAQLRRAACGLTFYRDAEELARLALRLSPGA